MRVRAVLFKRMHAENIDIVNVWACARVCMRMLSENDSCLLLWINFI